METLAQGPSQPTTKPSRRHSIAVALRRLSLSNSVHDQDHLAGLYHHHQGGGRRASIQDSLIQFSKTFKIGVSGNGVNNGSELGKYLSRTTLQTILSKHFMDKKLKIAKMNVKPQNSVNDVNDDTEEEENDVYDVEVLFKSHNLRKRMDLSVRVIHNMDDEELYVYNTFIKDIQEYLSTKENINQNLVPVLDQIDCSKFQEIHEEEVIENDLTKIFILESLSHKGYKDDISDLDGLDYEHSIMAISYLAKFHATSYCYRKEKKVSLPEKYCQLQEIQIPKFSSETCDKVEEILKRHDHLSQHANMFTDAMREGIDVKTEFIEHFRVLSHGNFLRENLQYCYRSELESRYFCSDLIFLNFGWAHSGSCVLDLLQFLFTSIDPEVRRDFLADFVCSVYYDNFVKTVIALNDKLSIFRLKHFVREFEENLLYGFLFSLDIKLKLHENIDIDGGEDDSGEEDTNKEDEKLESYIVALANDMIQFKMNLRASILN